MNKNNVLLSICIPTYNRAQKLRSLVQGLLSSGRKDVEFIVVDNLSSDSTEREMTQVQDDRLRYLRNDVALPGMANIIRSLTYAQGRFALLCLDKDNIDPAFLTPFVEKLEALPEEVSFGQLELNLPAERPDCVWPRGYKTLVALGYKCTHPSGMFVRTESLRRSDVVPALLDRMPDFPFCPDIIKARLAMCGSGCSIGLPLVNTETRHEAKAIKSFTYNGANLWFSPDNVARQSITFLKDLQGLKLDREQKSSLATTLYIDNLYNATWRYRTYLGDESLCEHHGIETRTVTSKEMISNYRTYVRSLGTDPQVRAIPFDRLRVVVGKVRWWLKLIQVR